MIPRFASHSQRSIKEGTLLLALALAAFAWMLREPDFVWPALAQQGPPPLSISNIQVSALAQNSATITWTTNLDANALIRYGTTPAYGEPPVSDLLNYTTSHSLTLTGLNAGTTYHYQVESSTQSGETRTSLDRQFTTPQAGQGDTTPPQIFNILVDAVDTSATVNFTTNENANALVRFGPAPAGNWNLYPPGNEAAQQPVQLRQNHAVFIGSPQFTLTPSTVYYYRIRAEDGEGNQQTTGELQFTTSGNPFDHTFSTGACPDGTQLGQCNLAGQYCDQGILVYRCDQCGYQCPAGQTCQFPAQCIDDPALTGTATQCNSSDCYDPQSGAFIEPAEAGCWESWPRCNANTVLKVRLDRVCNKWLTCRTGEEVRNPTTGQTENLCYDLTTCAQIGPQGQCRNFIGDRHCINDALKFCVTSADCPGGAACESAPTNITYRTPDDVDRIRNLTGKIIAALEWYTQDGSPVINQLGEGQPGYFHPAIMPQIGTKVDVRNGSFEDRNDLGIYTALPWKKAQGDEGDPANIEDKDPALRFNRVLEIRPDATPLPSFTGAKIEEFIDAASATSRYFVALRAKAGPGVAGQTVAVRFTSSSVRRCTNDPDITCTQDADCGAGTCPLPPAGFSPVTVGTMTLTDSWKAYVLGTPNGATGATGRTNLEVVLAGGPTSPFFIDDVSVSTVLKASNQPVFLSATCRLYPREDSPACEYVDREGVIFKGMRGYCLEKDPRNANLCISWWPVDVIAGETFGLEEEVGYRDRVPLYYCLESAGTLSNASIIAGQQGTNYELLTRAGCKTNALDEVNDCGNEPHQADLCGGQTSIEISDGINGDDPPNDPADNSAINFVVDHLTDIVTLPVRDTARAGQRIERSIHREEIALVRVTANYRTCAAPGECGSGDNGFFAARSMFLTTENNYNASTKRLVGCVQPVAVRDDTDSAPDPSTLNLNQCDVATSWALSEYSQGFPACGGEDWVQGARTRFNLQFDNDGFLESYKVQFGEPGGGAGVAWYEVTFYLKEYCTKLARVAESNGNDAAWSGRVQSDTHELVLPPPALNYTRATDLQPFGGAVIADDVDRDNPEGWELLNAMAPDLTRPAPYQARSGAPFACRGDCSQRVCVGGPNHGDLCTTAVQCDDNDPDTAPGACQGVGQCEGSLTACTQDADCGVNSKCVGGAGSGRGQQFIVDPLAPFQLDFFAQHRLQRLFAKTYGLWEWAGTCSNDGSLCASHSDCGPGNTCREVRYRRIEPAGAGNFWNPPRLACRACGNDDTLACRVNADCGAGNACPSDGASSHPAFNGANPNADICGIPPDVFNIRFGNETAPNQVRLGQAGLVFLKFNSNADPEQLPITTLRIHWGDEENDDGTRNENGFDLRDGPFAPRSDPANPHAPNHVYQCDGPSSPYWTDIDGQGPLPQACYYFPKVQVQDNWGWCDNGQDTAPCSLTVSTWQPQAPGDRLMVIVEGS